MATTDAELATLERHQPGGPPEDVPAAAVSATIKDAFRKLSLKYRPDRNKEPGAEERFKEIAEAYAVLSDPTKRREYDARGFAGVAGLTPEDLLGGLGFDFGSGLFDRFFLRRAGRPRGKPRGCRMNRESLGQLRAAARLEIVPGATHLFEEPGALDVVARLAWEWFQRHLVPA